MAQNVINAANMILNVMLIVLLLFLFYKLGFFRRGQHTQPAAAEAEIVKWSPLDVYCHQLESVTVQDGHGNVAHARYGISSRKWEFACNGMPLTFQPTEYRSSAHR